MKGSIVMLPSKKHRMPVVICYMILSILTLLDLNCTKNRSLNPSINNGFIDLSQWDFEKNGMVELKGNWKFKWNEDNPDFIKRDFDDSDWELFNVPNCWNSRTKKRFGYCWLRLKLKLPSHSHLGLYAWSCLASTAIYINGKKVREIGKVGNSKETSLPMEEEFIIPLPSDSTYCIVALKIANYFQWFGGPHRSPRIGTFTHLIKHIQIDTIITCIIFGIILMMTFYHFILWLDRKDDKTNFYFLIFCTLTSVYILLYQPYKIIPLNSSYVYIILVKLFYISGIWTIPILLLYINSLLEINRYRGIYCSIIFAFLLTLFTSISPCWGFTGIGSWYFIPFTVYILYILVSSFANQKKYSFYFLMVGSIMILSYWAEGINFFYLNIFSFSPYIYSIIVLLILQSVLISKKFLSSFKKAEYLSRNLEQEVHHQTIQLLTQKKELEITNRKLKELDRFKTEFFQNITHEFRTPLTLILSPVDNIIKGMETHSISTIKDQLYIIKRNARQLFDLINQILDLARIDAGKMHLSLEKIDLSSLCTSVYQSFAIIADSKKITYTIRLPENVVYVYSDRNKILRVLSNLLSNAFKFTSQGGEIIITIDYPFVPEYPTRNNVELVGIAIRDTGIGIPEKEIYHIFERFHQVDGSTSRQHGGTGIGLALAKECMDMLGGDLTVQSSPGKGSVFNVLLPTNKETHYDAFTFPEISEEHSPISSVAPLYSETNADAVIVDCIIDDSNQTGKEVLYTDSKYDYGKKIVFLLEDNEDLLLFLKKNLEPRYNVFAAMNGLQGLEKIKKLPRIPDIIVSDIMMPSMDGLDFYQNLTLSEEFLHIPIIFLTAKTHEQKRALSLGAVDYICKPFNIDELTYKIDSHLNIYEHRDKKVAVRIQEKISVALQVDKGISAPESLFNERCRQYDITEIEKNIIKFIKRGYSDKEIANELYRSINTVNTHIKNIYKKSNSNTRIDLINRFYFE